MSNETCHIYVIAHIKGNRPLAPIKVGISSSPEARLATLQTANPKPLVLLATFAVPTRAIAKAIEAAFHSVQADFRMSGEWFDLPPIRAVEAMCSNMRSALEYFLDDEELRALAIEHSGLRLNEEKLVAWRSYAARNLNDNSGDNRCR